MMFSEDPLLTRETNFLLAYDEVSSLDVRSQFHWKTMPQNITHWRIKLGRRLDRIHPSFASLHRRTIVRVCLLNIRLT